MANYIIVGSGAAGVAAAGAIRREDPHGNIQCLPMTRMCIIHVPG